MWMNMSEGHTNLLILIVLKLVLWLVYQNHQILTNCILENPVGKSLPSTLFTWYLVLYCFNLILLFIVILYRVWLTYFCLILFNIFILIFFLLPFKIFIFYLLSSSLLLCVSYKLHCSSFYLKKKTYIALVSGPIWEHFSPREVFFFCLGV